MEKEEKEGGEGGGRTGRGTHPMKTEMTTKWATLVAKGQAYVTTAVITAAGTRMFRGPAIRQTANGSLYARWCERERDDGGEGGRKAHHNGPRGARCSPDRRSMLRSRWQGGQRTGWR